MGFIENGDSLSDQSLSNEKNKAAFKLGTHFIHERWTR